jgi:hypothetical protein
MLGIDFTKTFDYGSINLLRIDKFTWEFAKTLTTGIDFTKTLTTDR